MRFSLAALSPFVKELLFVWAVLLLLVSVFVLFRCYEQNLSFMRISFIVYAAVAEYIVAQIAASGIRGSGTTLFDLENSNAVYLIIVLAFLTAATVIMLVRYFYTEKVSLTRSSIKEAVDKLPMGMCFGYILGERILSNIRMEELHRALTGKVLTNVESFWNELTLLQEREALSNLRRDDELVVFQGKKAWLFQKEQLPVGGEQLTQITAIDVTELYAVNSELAAANKKLDEIHELLKEYGDKIEEVIKEEEIADASTFIHHDTGKILIGLRNYLSGYENSIPLSSLLSMWKQNLAGLKQVGSKSGYRGDDYKEILGAAEFLGIKIKLDGELPDKKDARHLILAGMRESITNAAKHGHARVLNVRIRETRLGIKAVFTDDGEFTGKEFAEGGGLKGLRRAVENVKGTMTVARTPGYCLTLVIPV